MKALKEREKMLAYILDKKGNVEQEPVRMEKLITHSKVLLFILSGQNEFLY